jgi:hypothetical protein
MDIYWQQSLPVKFGVCAAGYYLVAIVAQSYGNKKRDNQWSPPLTSLKHKS